MRKFLSVVFLAALFAFSCSTPGERAANELASRIVPEYASRIEFKEDFEHEPIEGWPSEVKTELAGILGFENENDIPFGEDFNASQTYDENNISTWEVGAHEVSFHVFGIETTYKVNVVKVGYTLSVDDVVLFQGNMDIRQ